MKQLLFYILSFFDFILVFTLVILAMEVVFNIMMKKFEFKEDKIGFYGIFMHLDTKGVIALSAATIKYIFILWSLLGGVEITIAHLIFLLIISTVYNLSLLNIKGLFLDIVNSVVIYFYFLCCNLLNNYLAEVRSEWYIIMILILSVIFVAIYSSYFILKNINDVVGKNEYVRRVKNEKIIRKL